MRVLSRLALMVLSIALLELACGHARAQIDSTWREFYPLEEGNEWQYRNEINTLYWQRVAVGDTIVAGRHYVAIGVPPQYLNGFQLVRIDSLGRVLTLRIFANEPLDSARETFIYWLGREPGAIWPLSEDIAITLYPRWFMRYDGIYQLFFLGQWIDVMRFTPGACRGDGTDSVWYNVPWLLARGIGMIRQKTTEFQDLYLTGAVINHLQYGTMVSIKGSPPPSGPLAFELKQNFPNPFNSSTTLTYTIPSFGLVHLSIVDLMGREVRHLVHKFQPPGMYSVRFEAGDLASGSYLCILRTGHLMQAKSLVLLK